MPLSVLTVANDRAEKLMQSVAQVQGHVLWKETRRHELRWRIFLWNLGTPLHRTGVRRSWTDDEARFGGWSLTKCWKNFCG